MNSPQTEQSDIKHAGGRPTIITAETINTILAALQRGLTIKTACDMAGISETVFYTFQRDSVEFSQRVKAARAYGKSIASDIVLDVLHDHNRVTFDEKTKKWSGGKYSSDQRVNTAKWWLEKQEPEAFGRVTINAQQNNQQNNYFNMNYEQLDKMLGDAGINLSETDPTELLLALEEAKESFEKNEEDKLKIK